MAVTIAVDDELAERLDYQARALQLTLDGWATRILRHGFELDVHSSHWRQANARRLALIQQRRQTGLNPAETAELDALEELAAKAVAAWDRPMLQQLAQFEAAAGVVDHD